ncbi:hypothetical protein [Micromonospora sp. MW-13]
MATRLDWQPSKLSRMETGIQGIHARPTSPPCW